MALLIQRITPNRHTYGILVVEDDPMARRFIIGQLREQGYAVIEAASGEEAIALTSEHPPGIGTIFTKSNSLEG